MEQLTLLAEAAIIFGAPDTLVLRKGDSGLIPLFFREKATSDGGNVTVAHLRSFDLIRRAP